VDEKKLFIKIVKIFENRKLSFFNVKSLNSMLNLKILTEKSFFFLYTRNNELKNMFGDTHYDE